MPTLDLTVARPFSVEGIRRSTIGQYTGPASYATGGDAFVAGDVKMGVLERVDFEVATDGTNIRLIFYDHTNEKAVWFVPSTGAQVADTTDLSSYNARFEATGK